MMTGSDYKDSGHKWLLSIPKASQCVGGERRWEERGLLTFVAATTIPGEGYL